MSSLSEIRLRPRGGGRFFGAAFLTVWLCGWVFGELFALFLLGHGLWSLFTGQPPRGADEPLRLGPALAVGGFLLVWLSFWTIGGVLAIREWFRLLWASDLLTLDRQLLTRVRRLGPFVSRRQWPVETIHRVYVQRVNTRLMVQVGPEAVELSDLGTPDDRTTAATQLRAALALPEDEQSAGLAALPQSWQEITEPRGDILLVPNLQTRRKQAAIVSAIALVVWTVTGLLAWQSWHEPTLWVLTSIVLAAALGLAWGALWLHRGRKEWRLERGKLVHQRRYGTEVTELAEARALELIETADSDNDHWYELRAVNLSLPPLHRTGKLPSHLRIHHTIHDPTEPRSLGLYLAQRAQVSFEDRVPTETDRQAEQARSLQQLAQSGKIGAWLARRLPRR